MNTTRWRLSVALSAAMLAACGGGSSGSSSPNDSGSTPPAKAATVTEAIARLEAAGTTPALDHGDTLAGTDANTNGVRDDVDRYIDAKADSSEQKASLRMMSKALGTAMSATATDAASLRTATDQLNNAVACVWKRYPASTADAQVQDMRKVTVNTRQRYDAYMAFNAAMAGSVVKLPKEVRCD